MTQQNLSNAARALKGKSVLFLMSLFALISINRISNFRFDTTLIFEHVGKSPITLIAKPYNRDQLKGEIYEVLDIDGTRASYCFRCDNSTGTPRIYNDIFSDCTSNQRIKTKWMKKRRRETLYAAPGLCKKDRLARAGKLGPPEEKRRKILAQMQKNVEVDPLSPSQRRLLGY